MTWTWKRELFAWGVIAAIIAIVALLGGTLPDRVPTHFDFHGNVDDTMQRSNFLVMIVGLAVGIYLLLTFIPFIDPLWLRLRSRYDVLMLIRDFTMGFLLVILLLTVFAGPEGHISTRMLGVSLGILFALIGNYLPKVPRNWFFGIRTPWTLTTEIVWQKSHIVGGWMFMVTGILAAVLSVIGVGMEYALLPGLAVTAIVSGVIYPFVLNKRLASTDPRHHGDVL
jgi:uncharacterized membrane protein